MIVAIKLDNRKLPIAKSILKKVFLFSLFFLIKVMVDKTDFQ